MADEDSGSPILDLLASMNRAGIETSTLDAESIMLVRLAALVAVDAPPVSYMLNLEMAGDVERRRRADRGHARRNRPDCGLGPRRVRGRKDDSRPRARAQPRGARRAAGLSTTRSSTALPLQCDSEGQRARRRYLTPRESDWMVRLQQVVRVDARLDLPEPPVHVRWEEALRLGRPLHEVQEGEPGVPRREGGLDTLDMALDCRLRLRTPA